MQSPFAIKYPGMYHKKGKTIIPKTIKNSYFLIFSFDSEYLILFCKFRIELVKEVNSVN